MNSSYDIDFWRVLATARAITSVRRIGRFFFRGSLLLSLKWFDRRLE